MSWRSGCAAQAPRLLRQLRRSHLASALSASSHLARNDIGGGVCFSRSWRTLDWQHRLIQGDANHIIFCGYSFPDADIHIKYLVKRAQTNRENHAPLKVTVINHDAKKTPEQALDEERRYKRFLGNDVDYTDLSFERFAANPLPIIRHASGTIAARSGDF